MLSILVLGNEGALPLLAESASIPMKQAVVVVLTKFMDILHPCTIYLLYRVPY